LTKWRFELTAAMQDMKNDHVAPSMRLLRRERSAKDTYPIENVLSAGVT